MRTFAQIFAYCLLAASALIAASSFFGAYIAFGLGASLLLVFAAPVGLGTFAVMILLLCSIDSRLEEANRKRDAAARVG